MTRQKRADNSRTIKSIKTDKWTEIILRAVGNKVARRWKFVSFRGPHKRESAGIVDLLAIRRNTTQKPNDLFEFIIIQAKGGTAAKSKLKPEHFKRLKKVKDHYKALAIVYFRWNKEKRICKFYVLDDKGNYQEHSCKDIFG